MPKDISLNLLRQGLERRYKACLPPINNLDLIVELHNYVELPRMTMTKSCKS